MTDQNTNLLPDPKALVQSGQLEQVQAQELKTWRRKCGCIRTSEKLKNILNTFPSPPPPTPNATYPYNYSKSTCGYCAYPSSGCMEKAYTQSMEKCDPMRQRRCFLAVNSRSWQVIAELVQLVQLSVTATALALYYLIYCYMQLVYYTLRSALYFHNADGPMKITIGVVTVTSLIVGFNLMLRMERILGILY